MISYPAATEFASYYGRYVGLLDPAADVLALLRAQPAALRHILTGLTETEAAEAPAPGKWSVKEALIHLIDTERVFAYRALCVARGEQTPLPAFDQDEYVAAAELGHRTIVDLLAEYATQRAATLALFSGLTDNALARRGTMAGNPVSARALAWIIAGHDEHHQRHFAQLLHK